MSVLLTANNKKGRLLVQSTSAELHSKRSSVACGGFHEVARVHTHTKITVMVSVKVKAGGKGGGGLY